MPEDCPPIKRTKVVPEPWRTNLLVRMWRRMTGRPNAPQPPKRELPAARWRTVGSIRRYILLALMIGQTIVAGWYMKSILPYQGWSFVDLDEVLNQPLWDTVVQVWPYALQTSILILFGILFCWVSAGFWTALMGFLELLTGRDKYKISGSSAGNEPIARGAYRAGDADLQRGRAAGICRPAGDVRIGGRQWQPRPFRLLRAQRHQRHRHRRGRTAGLAGRAVKPKALAGSSTAAGGA